MNFRSELENYLRYPYRDSRWSSGQSIHEGLKAQLYVFAYKFGYRPVMEAIIANGNRLQSRIDCLLLTRDGSVICGIEIDSSVREKSILKLLALPSSASRVIVVYAGGRDGNNDEWSGFGGVGFVFVRLIPRY